MDGNGNLSGIFSVVGGMIDGVVIFDFYQVLATDNADEIGHGYIFCKLRC